MTTRLRQRLILSNDDHDDADDNDSSLSTSPTSPISPTSLSRSSITSPTSAVNSASTPITGILDFNNNQSRSRSYSLSQSSSQQSRSRSRSPPPLPASLSSLSRSRSASPELEVKLSKLMIGGGETEHEEHESKVEGELSEKKLFNKDPTTLLLNKWVENSHEIASREGCDAIHAITDAYMRKRDEYNNAKKSATGVGNLTDVKSVSGSQGMVIFGFPDAESIFKQSYLKDMMKLHRDMDPHDFTIFESTCKIHAEVHLRFFDLDKIPMKARDAVWSSVRLGLVDIASSISCWYCRNEGVDKQQNVSVAIVQSKVNGLSMNDWLKSGIVHGDEYEAMIQVLGIIWGLYSIRPFATNSSSAVTDITGATPGDQALFHNDVHTANVMITYENVPDLLTYNIAGFICSFKPTMLVKLIDYGLMAQYPLSGKYRSSSETRADEIRQDNPPLQDVCQFLASVAKIDKDVRKQLESTKAIKCDLKSVFFNPYADLSRNDTSFITRPTTAGTTTATRREEVLEDVRTTVSQIFEWYSNPPDDSE